MVLFALLTKSYPFRREEDTYMKPSHKAVAMLQVHVPFSLPFQVTQGQVLRALCSGQSCLWLLEFARWRLSFRQN